MDDEEQRGDDGAPTTPDAGTLPFGPAEAEEFGPRQQARLGASRELNHLREQFGRYELVEERSVTEPELYEGGLELVEEYGLLADAGAVVRDDEGRVLLVRHAAVDGWGHPSATYEGEASLVETAEREVRAATGVDCAVTGFCYVRERHIVRAVERDIEPGALVPPSYPTVTVVFTASGSGPVAITDHDAVFDARWFDDPPDETVPFTAGLLDRC